MSQLFTNEVAYACCPRPAYDASYEHGVTATAQHSIASLFHSMFRVFPTFPIKGNEVLSISHEVSMAIYDALYHHQLRSRHRRVVKLPSVGKQTDTPVSCRLFQGNQSIFPSFQRLHRQGRADSTPKVRIKNNNRCFVGLDFEYCKAIHAWRNTRFGQPPPCIYLKITTIHSVVLKLRKQFHKPCFT